MNFFIRDITKLNVECIVSSTNGMGLMDKGVSESISRNAGPTVSESSREICFKHGNFKPGEVFMTDSGLLVSNGIKNIIHAVLISKNGDEIQIKNCEKALNEALELAIKNNFKSIAIPALGLTPRNSKVEEIVKMMLNVCKKYESQIEILIVDRNINFIYEIKNIYAKENGTN